MARWPGGGGFWHFFVAQRIMLGDVGDVALAGVPWSEVDCFEVKAGVHVLVHVGRS